MTHWDCAMPVPKRESGRMFLSEVGFRKPGLAARLQRASSISNAGGTASLLRILTQGEKGKHLPLNFPFCSDIQTRSKTGGQPFQTAGEAQEPGAELLL